MKKKEEVIIRDGNRCVITPILRDDGTWQWAAYDGRGDIMAAGMQRHRSMDGAVKRARQIFSSRFRCSVSAPSLPEKETGENMIAEVSEL